MKFIGAMLKVLCVGTIVVPLIIFILPGASISWFIDHGIIGAIIFIALVIVFSLVMTGHVDLGGTQVYESSSKTKIKTHP